MENEKNIERQLKIQLRHCNTQSIINSYFIFPFISMKTILKKLFQSFFICTFTRIKSHNHLGIFHKLPSIYPHQMVPRQSKMKQKNLINIELLNELIEF